MLRNQLEQHKPDYCFAAVSSLIRSSDITTFSDWLRPFRPTHLVGTMLDLTPRYGSLLAAARRCGAKLTYVTDAPGGMGRLSQPDPADLTRRLLDTETDDD